MASMFSRMASVSPTPSSSRDRQNEGSGLARRLGTWKISDTGDVLTPRPSIFRACSKLVLGSEGSKLALGSEGSKLALGSEGSKLALGSEGSKLALGNEEAPERQLKQTDVLLPQQQSRRLRTQTTLATLMDRNLLSPVSSPGEGGHEVSCSPLTRLPSKSSEAHELLPAGGLVSTSPSPRGPPQLPAAATSRLPAEGSVSTSPSPLGPLQLPAAATSRLLSKDPLQQTSPRRHLEVPAVKDSLFRSPRRRSAIATEKVETLKDSRRRSVSGEVEVQRTVSESGARIREEIALSRRRSLMLDDEFEVVLDDVAQKAGVEAATGSAEAARRAGLKLMDRQEALGKNASMEAGEEYRRQLVNAQERSEQQNADPSLEEEWEHSKSRPLLNRRASMADVIKAEVKVGERLRSMNRMLDRLSHADGVSSCPL
ncbi:unnamed protein product [Polarella glacialis]|uniref:Uncharacterized protein n=1 Tax=Polarella glacialis TaxID=89957 RepID=A0A813DI57_POLGL|nr:unnamed protein product [Polarella glacialis]